ncbi:hypothetical protein [Hungatella hathewayi]|uniref:hypothetical protein n=1 Tax=Hungatella hathewayi TaxID=154046 RepID=UPI0035636336
MNGKEKRETNNIKQKPADSQRWFSTFTYIGIPIIGFIYLIILSRSKNQPIKQDFAKAYIKFKLLHLAIVLIFLCIVICISIPYIDKLLSYLELL